MSKINKRLKSLYKEVMVHPFGQKVSTKRIPIAVRHYNGQTFWGTIARPDSTNSDDVT
jgi:hypothetical protein